MKGATRKAARPVSRRRTGGSLAAAGKRGILSSRAPLPVGAYVHARRAGNLLFLSGIGPRRRDSVQIPGVTLDSEGNVVAHDIEIQCRAAFENVRLVLEDAGSSWEKIVDVTVYLTHMKQDFPTFNRIYAEFFKDDLPARTTVEVTSLPTPIAVEVKVVATLD